MKPSTQLPAAAMAASLLALTAVPGHAQILRTWTPTVDANLTASSNWSGGVLPTIANDSIGEINAGTGDVLINSAGLAGYRITQNARAARTTTGAGSLVLDTGYYTLAGGSLTGAGTNVTPVNNFSIGSTNGAATLTISGGTFNFSGAFATQNLTASQFNMSAGSATVGSTSVRQQGAVNISGGTFDAGTSIQLGQIAVSPVATTFTVSGGSVTTSGSFTFNNASSGTAPENILTISGSATMTLGGLVFVGSSANNDSYVNILSDWTGSLKIGSFSSLTNYYSALAAQTNSLRFNGAPVTDFAGFSSTFQLNGSNALIIPEPSTYALLALGLASLAVFRRRR